MACGQDIILKLVTKALEPTMRKIERAFSDIGPKMKAEGERIANQRRSSGSGSGSPRLSRPGSRQEAIQQALSVHQAYLQQQDPNHHYGTATTPTRSQAKKLSDSDFPTVEIVACLTGTLMRALFGAGRL